MSAKKQSPSPDAVKVALSVVSASIRAEVVAQRKAGFAGERERIRLAIALQAIADRIDAGVPAGAQ